MNKLTNLAICLASVGLTLPVNAAVSISATDGNAVYAGPTPTYDFETPAPFTATNIFNMSSSGIRAAPLGSTGFFGSVGPSDGTPGFLNLATFVGIRSISLLWGSVDAYNTLFVIRRDGSVMSSFTGSAVSSPANGNQTLQSTNPIATLSFTDADRFDVGGLRFASSQNAFEFDNVSIAAVPEPATWLMMIAGFGLIGGLMRRRNGLAGLASA